MAWPPRRVARATTTLCQVYFRFQTNLTVDRVRSYLDKAKEEYRSNLDKASATLKAKFDERVKAVADTGNLDGVLELKADRKSFESDAAEPKSKLMKTAWSEYQEVTKASRQKMTESYDKAVKELTKQLDTDRAEEVRKEALAFRTGRLKDKPPLSSLPKPGQESEWEVVPGVKIAFCWIPPGKLQLGSTPAEQAFLVSTLPGGKRPGWIDDENMTTRGTYTTSGFWMGKYEITQSEWSAVMGSNPSMFNGKDANKAKGFDTSRFPVENISWNDCQDFLKKLNDNPAAIEKAVGSKVKFALPHENEWEYACRGGKGIGFPFYFGTALNGTQGNCKGTEPWGINAKPGPNLERTIAVGSYAKDSPHPWGLCDMHGNVEEWCENKYEDRMSRALRGGRWEVPAWACRSANRNQTLPANKGSSVGARICIRLQ